MSGQPPTTMFKSKCEILRSPDGYEGVLIKNLTPSSAQMVLFTANNGCIPAGRVFSVNASTGKAELGTDGRRVAYINRRSTGAPMTGIMSDPTAIADAPHVTAKTGAEHKVLMYALVQGMEVQTTEFIAGSYAINELLKAPDAAALGNDNAATVASGGKLTNQTVLYGKHAVVGVVTAIPAVNQHNISVLTFYALYAPPIEGVTDALKTTINA